MGTEFKSWALTPPMGWNSWDCFGGAVTEEEIRQNAEYMAEHLASYGWEYIVIDIEWYNSGASRYHAQADAQFVMDAYGRFLPTQDRFPSAIDGRGFKTLADYLHEKGLKFGFHIMRGIPRQAVKLNCPIKDSPYHVADIADINSTCHWNQNMYGIDIKKPGAQEYYNSLFNLYAEWDLDYIKVDDCSHPYYAGEIEAIRKAIDQCGRQIVFSLSPGPTPIKQAVHVSQYANLWRISFDVWDNFWQLRLHFYLCARWAKYIKEGTWPDADMIPLGHIRVHSDQHGSGPSKLTQDEQRTLMTLFTIFRSPLMFGGHLPDNDEFTLSLITNSEVFQMHHDSQENKPLYTHPFSAIWVAKDSKSNDKFAAFFNFRGKNARTLTISAKALGMQVNYTVRDLWNQKDLGTCKKSFKIEIPPHGSELFRFSSI